MATARKAFLVAFFFLAVGASPGRAYDLESRSPLNLDGEGVAIHGYDPVANFLDGAPRPGDARFSASHGGAVYRFASAEHRDVFLSDPEKYVPAFGGFCAMGAAGERKADGDPLLWKIVDGRLYLNVNAQVNRSWLANPAANISKANGNWTRIKDETPKRLFELHPLK